MRSPVTVREEPALRVDDRVAAVDWTHASDHLDAHGWAMIGGLLTEDE